MSAAISRDLEQLNALVRSGGSTNILEKIEIIQRGFANYLKEFGSLAEAEVKLGLNETAGLVGSLRAARFTTSNPNSRKSTIRD